MLVTLGSAKIELVWIIGVRPLPPSDSPGRTVASKIRGWYSMDRRKAMDPQDKSPTPGTELMGTFSEAEYSANAGKVIGHAAATGTAIVSAADGSPRVVISIPTVDLPTLGD